MTRAFTCQTCRGHFEHCKPSGPVPKRCRVCQAGLKRLRRRSWYEANRHHAIEYSKTYYLAISHQLCNRRKAAKLLEEMVAC